MKRHNNRNLALDRVQKMCRYFGPADARTGYCGMLLDFNERTVPVSRRVRNVLVGTDRPEQYPEYEGLETRLADYCGVKQEQVLVTNGSSQGIDLVFRTFCERGDTVVIPTPSFASYRRHADMTGCRVIAPEYRERDFAFPLTETLAALTPETKLVIIGHPNNPTGTAPSRAAIARIAREAANSVVLVDEAYYEFSGQTVAGMIERYRNIVVVRTFSKAFGLAGLRVGYCLASPVHTGELAKVRGPFDVNIVGYRAACAALDDLASTRRYVQEVTGQGGPLVEEFFRKYRVRCYPSVANFVLFETDNPAEVCRLLADTARLRVLNLPGRPGLLRLTIGTAAHMKRFINAYRDRVLWEG